MSKDLLGAADAILQRNSGSPAEGVPFANDGQFVRGLRAGTLGAGSQLSSLGGALAERYGLNPQPAYDVAQALNERAAETAPRVTSFRDVNGLRDAGDYVAGLMGQSLPASAAALGAAALTRGGVGMRALASGGALTPLEAGDVVQRQQGMGAPVDAGEALQTGALSAGLQSVVPAVAGAKLAGAAGGLAAKGGLGAKVAKNALAIPAEGLTEASGELVKQLGSGQAQDLAGLDTGALAEAAVGGAAAGAPFAAAGAAGDALHGSKGAMRTKMAELGDKAEALKGRLSQKSDPTPAEGVGEGGKTQPASDTGLADGLMGFYDKAKTKVSDAADRVIAGKPLRDNPEYAETPPDSPAYQDLLKRMDGEHLAQVKQWGEDMLTKAGSWLTPERRAEVEQAMGDLGDQANRVKIATMEKARAAAFDAGRAADRLATRVKDWATGRDPNVVDEPRAEKPGTKKSEDYSGVRQLIADEVAPVVRETSPGLMEDAEGMQTLADGLRVFVEHAARTERKALPADVSRDLFDIMGDKTIPTLRKLYRAVQGENAGNTAKTEAFFSTLNDMMAQRKADTKLYDVMTKSLKPELQKTVTTGELRQEAELLQRWASRPAKDSAQDKVDSALIRERLQERYGSKAEAVLDAIERNRRVEESALADEGRVGVDEEGQPLAKQKADHTDALTERETDANESDALEKAGLSAMRFKGGAGADDRRTSPRALRTHPEKPDTDVLDAVAMTREMRISQPYQDGEVSGKRRDARMFKEAVARVTEKLGRSFEIPDRTIINESGMTWGQAKRFSDDRGPSRIDRELQKLRGEYADMRTIKDPERRAEKLRDITARAQVLLDERDASIVNDGERERTVAQDYLEAQGKESADPKNDNIHLAAETLTPEELQIKTGMDGQPLTKSTRPTADSLKGALDSRIKRMEEGRKYDEFERKFVGDVNKVAKRVGEKARALYEIYDDMQPMDRAALIGATQGKVSEAAPTVNALHKKYIENKAASEVAAQGPKARLEQRARSGDPELLKEIASHDDAAQLQRALDHLNKQDIHYSGIANAVDALNKRIGELASNPDVAYNLQRNSAQTTGSAKKFSLLGTELHKASGKPGFGATHDSPIRHEGVFDWRKHSGKGEGNAAFGAGTYLSTADGVHRSYKKQFTAQSTEGRSVTWDGVEYSISEGELYSSDGGATGIRGDIAYRVLQGASPEEALEMVRASVFAYAEHSAQQLADAIDVTADALGVDEIIDAAARLSRKLYALEQLEPADTEHFKHIVNRERWNRILQNARKNEDLLSRLDVSGMEVSVLNASPTYEVSVDIIPGQLLDWNKPLSQQSDLVQKALKDEVKWKTQKAWNGNTTYELAVGNTSFAAVLDAKDTPFGKYVLGTSLNGERFDTLEAAKAAGFEKAAKSALNGEGIYEGLAQRLGSQAKASDYLQSLGILGHRYAAFGGQNDTHPNYVIYDDSKISTNYVHFSKGATGSARANTAAATKAMADYLDRVLGPSVKRAWANISHAGEFDAATETIRVSVHALDPLSTAHHEALHAFFKKLRDSGDSDIIRTLLKAADSPVVKRQLEQRLAGEPEALKQLNDAEERVAYMYQFWAADPKGFKVGPETKGVLGKLKEFFRNVLGLWSNDERALHILEHFHQGDFAKDPSAFSKAMREAGRNAVIEKARAMTEPLARLSDSVFTAGGQRMRDTGIPALRELADKMKNANTEEGADPGYIPAARVERTRVMNSLGQRLLNFNKEHLNEALEALQRGDVDSASSPEARLAGKYVRRTLDEMFNYMQSAGVRINDLGVGKDYFPRMYDTNAISKKQQAFLDVLDRHGVKNSREVLHKLMTTEGSEFTVETMKPGMQNLKPRTLAHIPDAELAPFMRKDLFEVMNSYVTQATRRAEWARRFNDDGSGLRGLLDDAKAQGAKAHELEAAERYVRGVDGTLGDNINPTARRLMGNMIVYQNVRLLPLAIFSSIVDPAGIVVRGGTVGDAWHTFKRGVRETVKNFQSMPDKDGMTELAETLGVVDSATLIHTLGASYSQGMVGDSARKINDWYFRANLMEQFNTSMRVGATEAALKFLQRHNDGKASPHSARWLAELGLKAGDVKTGPDGRVLLTEADGLSAEQAGRMRIAVNRWVDGAVLRPDASDKPIWMNDPHWALVAHLKQFVYSFHETILKRVVHEFEHGNYTPVMALASYVPIMIASDLIKGALTNAGDQPEWKKNWGVSDYVWSGIERGGLLGVGQFRVDMMGDVARGGTGIGALAGPTLEQLGDAVKTLGGREAFGHFALKSLPANALYANALGGEGTDPKFVD